MRKPCATFYFSVEGETEASYLRWLQNTINESGGTAYTVCFDVKVCSPVSRVKRMTVPQRITIYHFCDCESASEEHQKRFKGFLDEMKNAEKLGKQVTYVLGYCNFSFELWILMHVTNAQRSLTDRSHYLKELNSAFHEHFTSMKEFKKEKNLTKIFEKLTLEDVRRAIKLSEKLMKQKKECQALLEKYKKFSFYKENPSLSLGGIFAEIFKKINLEL